VRTKPLQLKVGELGARWSSLLTAFTGGNPEIAAAVRKMWFTEAQGKPTMNGIDVAAVREAGDFIVEVNEARKKGR